MSQPDGEKIKEDVRKKVLDLFRAENFPGDADIADSILAHDYLPIVRGRGQIDRDREETLAKIANPSSSFHRHIDEAEIEVALFMDDRVAIARSLLLTTDSRENPPEKAAYRNLQVFLNRDDEWRCVAWQVTKVQ